MTARGNEPNWQIKVSDKAITFHALEGETFTIEPVPQPTTKDGTDVYTATVDGRHFTLTITDAVCADTMTGMPYPNTATVMMGDRKLAGCAGEPADLLHGDRPVEMIAGKALVAGSQPTLAFDQGGSVHGNGSCNRFFGKFTATGEGLTISETGASMMMCDQPLMDQERNLLAALEAVRRFEVASTGQLRLLGKDGQTLVSLGK
ncbi:META domain-containing protein [Mesorhizobium sp. AR07]|uniref:META domain-containing protein n=1 Tax=Mesorhizobium sp. AR07 TaxID=2865838 RepID=UPI00215E7881|nr:META domain-containing protein [Mesorhizobium sp. AR07]UVK42901.1 META domain-containing protein [Mesorhizobium sp. AR07]